MNDDIHVKHWWTFYRNNYECDPVSVKLDRIVAVTGGVGNCALMVEGKEYPIEITDSADYVREILEIYRLFTE